MIIDFHTHVFPDIIAKSTIEYLAELGQIPPFSDGTVKGLLEKMEEAGVDISIVLPVMTSPKQFETVNNFAAEINRTFADKQRRLISFAGIHPDCEFISERMRFIKDSGFAGVKIHPDYQHTYIDDDRYVEIMKAAMDNDLIVVTHAGVDAGYRNCPVRCTPDRVINLIRKVPHSKFVLAHFGAHKMNDDVLEKLCGENLYFDTSYVLRFITKEHFNEVVSLHGEDKILFGSDSPWSPIDGDVKIINSFIQNERTREKIFSENAIKLLGI